LSIEEKAPSILDLPVAETVDYMAEFEAHLRGRDISSATVRAYVIGASNFVEWFELNNGKGFQPVNVTSFDVRMWRDDLAKRLAAASVNNYLSGFSAFAAWAQTTGHAQHDPTDGIGGLKIQDKPLKWLERPEQYKLLRAIDENVQLGELRAAGDEAAPSNLWPKRDKAIFYVLFGAGLRISEAAALDVGDIEINPRSGKLIVRQGKGNKTRTVPLNKDTRKALSAWLEVRGHVAADDETALFISQKGGRLSKRACAGRIYVLADRGGMEDIHPHTLRHCFGKNLVDAGVGLERVAALMGHENLDTTRLYTMPSEADLQAAVEKTNWSD
jgi:integrase/recombinase XerC